MADEQAAAQQDVPQQQFSLQRIYCKDVSFESPATPEIFRKSYQPKVNIDLNTKSNAIDENGNFEVVLTITVTSKVEEETAFLVEVQQAGIFYIAGFETEQLRMVLGTAAINGMITINTAAEIAIAPYIARIGEKFNINGYRRANILDANTSALGYI